ncbi:MAG: phosphopantothenoylcysteine decarboxylase, partial [Bacteroidota bacterium]
GKRKKENQLLIGFALETDNGIENAKKKILNKNLDLIILNSPNEEGQGFKFETNKITLINKNNKIIKFELMHKKKMALEIAQYVHSHLM